MSIATILSNSIIPTITQQSLYDGLKQAFLNSGFAATFDEYTSGTDRIMVFAFVQDASKTYGTTYLRIRVTSAYVIGMQLFATWTAATDTGGSGSTEVTFTALLTTTPIYCYSYNAGNEYKLVMLTQGTTTLALGVFSPANKPDWWDMNIWNFAFIPVSNTFAIFRSTGLNPYANSENDTTLNSARMGTANPHTNRRDILPGIILLNQANQGISGRTSDDLIMCAGSGTTRFDILQAPGDTKQYSILNPIAGGLAVRTA